MDDSRPTSVVGRRVLTPHARSETLSARLRLALDVARVETWEVDLRTGELQWSHHCPELFGFEPGDDVSWRQIEATIHPEDRERARAQHRKLLRDGTPVNYEIRICPPGKSERVLRVRAEVVAAGTCGPARAIGITHDVTEERRREDELRTSRARLALAHEMIGLTSWELDPRTGERLWMHHPSGTPREARAVFEAMSLAEWREAVHPDDRSIIAAAFAQLVRDREPVDATYRITLPGDDEERIHHLRAVVLEDDSGEPERIVGTRRDVTAQHRAAAALRTSEARLGLVLEAAETGFALLEGCEVLFANEAFLEFTGYSFEEFRRRWRCLDFVAPEDREDAARSIEAIRRGDVDHYKATRRYLRRDGSSVYAQVMARKVPIGTNREAILFQVLDVTERRRAEETLQRLNAELEARAQERQELLQRLLEAEDETRRRVAFDIHDGPAQQLTGADMFLEAFRARRVADDPPAVEQFLDRAKSHLRTALLDTQRIMSDLRPASLDDLGLERALRTSFAETAARHGCPIEFRAAAEAPRLHANAEIALFRIAQEAVSNAVRHSGSSRIRVVLHTGARGTILTVRDWGRGIEPRPRRSRRGLGLISMRERAELFGGTFNVDSESGRGTTISVRLPPGLAAPARQLHASRKETNDG